MKSNEAFVYQTKQGTNCEHLFLAVLQQAIKDLNDDKAALDANAWFNSADQDLPSFIAICDLLNVDPNITRKRIYANSFFPS